MRLKVVEVAKLGGKATHVSIQIYMYVYMYVYLYAQAAFCFPKQFHACFISLLTLAANHNYRRQWMKQQQYQQHCWMQFEQFYISTYIYVYININTYIHTYACEYIALYAYRYESLNSWVTFRWLVDSVSWHSYVNIHTYLYTVFCFLFYFARNSHCLPFFASYN